MYTCKQTFSHLTVNLSMKRGKLEWWQCKHGLLCYLSQSVCAAWPSSQSRHHSSLWRYLPFDPCRVFTGSSFYLTLHTACVLCIIVCQICPCCLPHITCVMFVINTQFIICMHACKRLPVMSPQQQRNATQSFTLQDQSCVPVGARGINGWCILAAC